MKKLGECPVKAPLSCRFPPSAGRSRSHAQRNKLRPVPAIDFDGTVLSRGFLRFGVGQRPPRLKLSTYERRSPLKLPGNVL